MDGYLRLDGQIELFGIQEPIDVGDNIQFEDVVYHIESMSHTCVVTPDGVKSFSTSIALSHGMPADQSEATKDFPRYAGFSNKKVPRKPEEVPVAPNPSISYGEQEGGSDQFDYSQAQDNFVNARSNRPNEGYVSYGEQEDGSTMADNTSPETPFEKQEEPYDTETLGDNEILTSQDPGGTHE
jgi:hypothetical protein